MRSRAIQALEASVSSCHTSVRKPAGSNASRVAAVAGETPVSAAICLPGPLAEAPIADGRLRALLTRFAVTTPGVFLHRPGRRQVLPKLRAFIEHVTSYSGATIKTRPRHKDLRLDATHGAK
jgi:DNA-binding transcriptional LysR family regulator